MTETPKQPRSNETKKLLAFAEAVTRNIRSTLEKSSKPKRRVNHRKYMQRKVKQTEMKTTYRTGGNKDNISKSSRGKSGRSAIRTQINYSNNSNAKNIPCIDGNLAMFAENLENSHNNDAMQFNYSYLQEYDYYNEHFNFQGNSMFNGYEGHCPNVENVPSASVLCPNRTQSYHFNHQGQQPYVNVSMSPPRLSHYNCAGVYLDRQTTTSPSTISHPISSPCEILSDSSNEQNGQFQFIDPCHSMFAGQTFDNSYSQQLGQPAYSVQSDWHWLPSANHMGLSNGQGLVTT